MENFNQNQNLFADYYSYCLASLGAFSWSQEQGEKVISNLIEQNKISREEGMKVLEEYISQFKNNQNKLQSIVNEEVNKALSGLRLPIQVQMEELQKKVEELFKKFENQS